MRGPYLSVYVGSFSVVGEKAGLGWFLIGFTAWSSTCWGQRGPSCVLGVHTKCVSVPVCACMHAYLCVCVCVCVCWPYSMLMSPAVCWSCDPCVSDGVHPMWRHHRPTLRVQLPVQLDARGGFRRHVNKTRHERKVQEERIWTCLQIERDFALT